MNINVYKQNSSSNHSSSTIKDSISFSKINAKMKKRQINGAQMALQKSVQSNPNRGQNFDSNINGGAQSGIITKEKAGGIEREGRDGSVDAINSYT